MFTLSFFKQLKFSLIIISTIFLLFLYKSIYNLKSNTKLILEEQTSPSEKYLRTKLSNKTSNIGIIIVSDQNARLQYKQYSQNVECYAKLHKYSFVLFDPKHYYNCSHLVNFYFQKHCTVMNYMISMPHVNWFLVLDGDTFVLNSSKLIEDFIPINPNIHVVHYERFYTGEVMAGNYLIRNHIWSHAYLLTWVNFYSKLPQTGYHNHDNGALHMVILQMIEKSNEIQTKCYGKYQQSRNEHYYYKYIRCFRCAIGGQRIFKHFQLLRRGHGFARDFHVPFLNDFLLHGYKSDLNKYFYNSSRCTNDWLSNVRENLLITNMEIAKNMTIEKDVYAIGRYSECLGIADIRDCWPNCDQEITGEKLAKYLNALCL
ncbi:hypothetical protein I4U23_015911 [Adineta vaga]|nr:hypothetical protein I4U23_015911 [Adineta vaga]